MRNLYYFSIFDSLIHLSYYLFFIGGCGLFLVRRHLIIMLMSLEIILFAINLNLIVSSIFLDDITGQVLALIILTVAAGESAIGLAILVIFYRLRGVIELDAVTYLKG